MTLLVPIVLYGWIALVLAMFSLMHPRRALLASYFGAMMFLPETAIVIRGFPELTKVSITSFACVAAVICFDAGRLMRYRFSWIDLPILIWCLAPIPSSLTNELGLYDGISASANQILNWGIPYFMGRLYFTDVVAVRELAITLFLGGLVYIPLCLWEVRMSPQLHADLYGSHPTHFGMTKRYGGYRPMGFMAHGLVLGLFMTCATVTGAWLWRSGVIRQMFRLPVWLPVLALAAVTVLCKSTGAIVLLAGGVGLLFFTRSLRSSLLLALVIGIVPVYMFVRANNLWDGSQAVWFAEQLGDFQAQSLAGRLENESLVVEKALERPVFGWGGWGRSRVRDEFGRDITTTDGMWIIAMGRHGLVGLTAWLAVGLLPALLMLRRFPARDWLHPIAAPAAALAVVLILYTMDAMLNAFVNPVYMLCAGGLGSFYLAVPTLAARARAEYAAAMQVYVQQQAECSSQIETPAQTTIG